MTRFTPSKPVRLAGLALCFAAAFLAVVWVLPKLPLRQGNFPHRDVMPTFEPPADTFYAWSNDGELSHRMLWHDIGTSVEHARGADILFFGNSRLQLGLRGETIVPRAEALGLEAFALACGHSEQIRFALELIRRHDLRPKIFVASGAAELFTEGTSEVGRRAMESSYWEAWRSYFETQGAWVVKSHLHRALPKLDVIGERLVPMYIIYRSPRDGWWQPVREAGFLLPVRKAKDEPSYEHLLPLAAELKQEISSRGGLLVLTMVPYWDYSDGHLPFLAEQLDVPLVLPPADDLWVADRQHLLPDSARKYSEEFWRLFIAEPRVRSRLGLDGADR